MIVITDLDSVVDRIQLDHVSLPDVDGHKNSALQLYSAIPFEIP